MTRPIQITPINALLSSAVAIVLCLPLMVALLILRQVFRMVVKLRFGRSADLLPGCDCVMNFKALRNYEGLLNMTIRLDGKVTVEEIRDRFREKLVDLKTREGAWLHPKLRSTLKWFLGLRLAIVDYKNKFNIVDHVTYVSAGSHASNDSGNSDQRDAVICKNDSDLEEVFEQICNKEVFPGEPDRPPWRFHVFYYAKPGKDVTSIDQAKDEEVESYVTLHIDHAIVDGGSLSLTMMPAVLDLDVKTDPSIMFQNLKPLSRKQRMLLDFRALLLTPLTLVRTVFLGRERFMDVNPLRMRDGRHLGSDRYFIAPNPIPVPIFTSIRKTTGVKVNAIVGFCIYRALYRFCKGLSSESSKSMENGVESPPSSATIQSNGVKATGGNGSIPNAAVDKAEQWTFTIASPQSLWVPGDKLELINRSTALLYTCRGEELAGETDEERLKALNRVSYSLDDPCRFTYGWTTRRFLSVILNSLPMWIIDASGTDNNMENMTGVFSNIKGPDHRQRAFGKDMTRMIAYVSMWTNLDVGVVVGSYGGQMTLTIAGRKGSFKSREELRQLMKFYEEEIYALHNIAKKMES